MLRCLILLVLFAAPAGACGTDSDCFIGERTYRIHVPATAGPNPGAIVFAHGYRGGPQGTMRNEGFLRLADELGVALVAPKSLDDDWRIPGVPAEPGTDGARELAFFDALTIDLRRRFGIDTDRMLMTGFSAGGMMTWQLACQRPHLFRAFAPVSGTFWDPVPPACSGQAVTLIHVHGTADEIVPIEGRAIGSTRQGSLTRALAMLAGDGGYGPATASTEGELDCQTRTGPGGHVLEACFHPRGHDFRVDFVRRAWMRVPGLGAPG
jgi:polyhydroxybutyrate depolymerase